MCPVDRAYYVSYALVLRAELSAQLNWAPKAGIVAFRRDQYLD